MAMLNMLSEVNRIEANNILIYFDYESVVAKFTRKGTIRGMLG